MTYLFFIIFLLFSVSELFRLSISLSVILVLSWTFFFLLFIRSIRNIYARRYRSGVWNVSLYSFLIFRSSNSLTALSLLKFQKNGFCSEAIMSSRPQPKLFKGTRLKFSFSTERMRASTFFHSIPGASSSKA